MREIKFKAWHKEGKRMFQWDYVKTWDIPILEKAYHHVMLQYTGLKDKNGKEIYEGDIIKAQQSQAIFCHPEIFDIRYIIEDGMFKCCYSKRKYKDFCLTQRNINDCEIEIIGNIYENADLL